MPTNANTFNSRVTSEALEAKFRQVFPAQGGAELVQDLFASGVITPVVDFSSVAEGSILPANLQTAWDFSTGSATQTGSGSTTAISNTGFWLLNISATISFASAALETAVVRINDGASTKGIWRINENLATVNELFVNTADSLIVFLRTGDSLELSCSTNAQATVAYRQIADVNGNLVNPLGFTFS